MIKDIIKKFQSFFVDPEEVAAYQTVLPTKIHISFKKDSGYYICFIDGFGEDKVKGLLITEAKTYDGLITNLNQLVYSHIKMPEKIRPYYGNRFQPSAESRQRETGELTLVRA